MSFNYNIPNPHSFRPDPEDMKVWKSELTGKTHTSREALIADDTAFRMQNAVPTDEDRLLESMSAEQIKQLYRKVESAEQKKEIEERELKTAVLFTDLHPGFVTCPQNARVMEHYLRSHGIKDASLEQLEEAYQALRTAGLLVINTELEQKLQREQLRQQAADIKQRRAVEPSEEELYNMPLEQVRAKASFGWYR